LTGRKKLIYQRSKFDYASQLLAKSLLQRAFHYNDHVIPVSVPDRRAPLDPFEAKSLPEFRGALVLFRHSQSDLLRSLPDNPLLESLIEPGSQAVLAAGRIDQQQSHEPPALPGIIPDRVQHPDQAPDWLPKPQNEFILQGFPGRPVQE
jgi:hypothetical protein